jgi:phenylpropionate dioxygenase-like ring-hydroxylating dioxygenase large terminal subunit
MKSNISPAYYHDGSVYLKEQNEIFKKNWHFIGFKEQLKNHNDYVTRSIGDTPVLVQNMKGEVKAFLNVCSHRFSILQQEISGNRPLVCPYHGWSYNQNGIPTGIPKKPMFENFSESELSDMCLTNYTIDFCGDLCFVTLDAAASNLKDFLGDFFAELEAMSFSMGDNIDFNSMEIAANWKIIVENTLESYHVGLIHTNTFRKLGASGIKFNFSSLHSNWDADLLVKRTDDSLKKIEAMFAPREYYIDGYKHFLVFPNLLISTTYGTSYNFSLIEPMAANKTRFNSYVFVAKADETAKKALLGAYKQVLLDFNREVFKEDKDICELVQKGVAHTALPGVLSLEEERVHSFQNEYVKLMEQNES